MFTKGCSKLTLAKADNLILMQKIGLGGGCHWCTEAIFQSLIGVEKVEQGWISPTTNLQALSEAVIIHFQHKKGIDLQNLIAIHLYTHSATSSHSMRQKYRSAIYTFDSEQQKEAESILKKLQANFDQPIITEIIPFGKFKINNKEFLNYYYQNPEKPFCKTYINPKLKIILNKFSQFAHTEKLKHLIV